MAILDQQFRTITCDGSCGKTITFNMKDAKETVDANPWIQNVRVLNTGDGRHLTYCSDDCEVAGATTGAHNLPSKKVIDVAQGQSAIRQAAAEAAAKQQADKVLRAPQA